MSTLSLNIFQKIYLESSSPTKQINKFLLLESTHDTSRMDNMISKDSLAFENKTFCVYLLFLSLLTFFVSWNKYIIENT